MIDFYMVFHSLSLDALRVVSANLNGPGIKNLHKHIKRAEYNQYSSRCIINHHHDKLLCTQVIIENHKAIFSKEFRIAYSVSGDGIKTAKVISESSRYGAIVGGAHPNHFISIPSSSVDC